MELQLCAGEIQAYASDVLDESLALIHSALSIKSIDIILYDISIITHNQEQFNTLNRVIDDIMCNFTQYYYVAGDNYLEHPYYFETFEEGQILEDYHENYYDKNPLFKVEYEHLSETTTKVLFSIKDKEKCIQALDEYCSSYGFDGIYNDNENILTCKAKDKQLYELLTENDYNLQDFIVNDFKYMKAICYNEYLNKMCISNVYIGFDEDNKLACRCTISDEGFVENFGKSDNTSRIEESANIQVSKQKKARKHFSSSVQELYNYIKTYAKSRDYQIYPSELIGSDRRTKLYETMGTLTTMVNRLNAQYREIIRDDTVTLMRYDKTLECYMITDIWNN